MAIQDLSVCDDPPVENATPTNEFCPVACDNCDRIYFDSFDNTCKRCRDDSILTQQEIDLSEENFTCVHDVTRSKYSVCTRCSETAQNNLDA
eukprot:UN32443